MKIAVYEDNLGELRSWNPDKIDFPGEAELKFVGFEERNIERPKKIVTKTALYKGANKEGR